MFIVSIHLGATFADIFPYEWVLRQIHLLGFGQLNRAVEANEGRV